MNIKLTHATRADIKTIIQIQASDGFNHSYYLTEKRLLGLFSKGEEFILALVNNNAVGFASIILELRARIHFLSVSNEYQSKGVGSALLNKLIQLTKKNKCKMIYCYTEIDSPMETFLKKRGFDKSGFFRYRFGKGKNANIFTLLLGD